MAKRVITVLQNGLLLLAITLALGTSGFARRFSATDDPALAFAMENGVSIADLCGDGAAGEAKAGLPCVACHIAGTANLPPRLDLLIDLELAFAATVIAPRESRALASVLDPANTSQGPPVV